MSSFDARQYWEDRLGDDWSLRGVGLRRMGAAFNDLAYQRRGERFDAVVQEFLPDVKPLRVLDVGSGTGFYLDRWQRLGVGEIVGLDLTEAAVSNLRLKFPELTILQGDISDGVPELEPASFDVVSCMDVLFHIVDDQRFGMALAQIAALLKPGGTFLWSDLFVHGPEVHDRHIAIRSLYRIEAMVEDRGFVVQGRRPMFHYMGEPRDTSSKLLFHGWRAMMGVAALSEPLAGLAGKAMYRLDGWLDTRHPTEGAANEFMICTKS